MKNGSLATIQKCALHVFSSFALGSAAGCNIDNWSEAKKISNEKMVLAAALGSGDAACRGVGWEALFWR